MAAYYDDLFEKRSMIGAFIEKEMQNAAINKSRLCKETGISRPTLDKLLSGEITNKKNFDKHIEKIFQTLNIRPENILKRSIKIRAARSRLNLSQDFVSKATNISIQRLGEIEAGDNASLSEYRDIAACLGTDTRAIKNESVFEANTLGLDSMFSEKEDNEFSSFWGHIGILPVGSSQYHWFPISGKARAQTFQHMDQSYVIVPCMNNTVILLNMKNINNIYLLDEACDPPENCDWDPEVSEGEIPPVVYEALPDYFYGDHESMSELFERFMDKVVHNYNWTEDTLQEMNQSHIYFTDGKIMKDNIVYGLYENISEFLSTLLFFEDLDDVLPATLYFSSIDGVESIIPMNNVSMIKMPRTELEESIFNLMEEEW